MSLATSYNPVWIVALTISLAVRPITSNAAEAKPVIINGQVDENLIETEIPSLFTTMISAVSPETSQGAIILYAGIAAKTANFGIGPSMGPIAQKAIKEGFTPYAFQNPIYFGDNQADEVREELVGSFRDTSTQVHWVADTIRL